MKILPFDDSKKLGNLSLLGGVLVGVGITAFSAEYPAATAFGAYFLGLNVVYFARKLEKKEKDTKACES